MDVSDQNGETVNNDGHAQKKDEMLQTVNVLPYEN